MPSLTQEILDCEGIGQKDKIICPLKQCFKYVLACEAMCKNKRKCTALRDYYDPWLLEVVS